MDHVKLDPYAEDGDQWIMNLFYFLGSFLKKLRHVTKITKHSHKNFIQLLITIHNFDDEHLIFWNMTTTTNITSNNIKFHVKFLVKKLWTFTFFCCLFFVRREENFSFLVFFVFFTKLLPTVFYESSLFTRDIWNEIKFIKKKKLNWIVCIKLFGGSFNLFKQTMRQ